jgi:hypothetical protein
MKTQCLWNACPLPCSAPHLHQGAEAVDVGLLQVAVPQLRARLAQLLLPQPLVVLLAAQLRLARAQLTAQPAWREKDFGGGTNTVV